MKKRVNSLWYVSICYRNSEGNVATHVYKKEGYSSTSVLLRVIREYFASDSDKTILSLKMTGGYDEKAAGRKKAAGEKKRRSNAAKKRYANHARWFALEAGHDD